MALIMGLECLLFSIFTGRNFHSTETGLQQLQHPVRLSASPFFSWFSISNTLSLFPLLEFLKFAIAPSRKMKHNKTSLPSSTTKHLLRCHRNQGTLPLPASVLFAQMYHVLLGLYTIYSGVITTFDSTPAGLLWVYYTNPGAVYRLGDSCCFVASLMPTMPPFRDKPTAPSRTPLLSKPFLPRTIRRQHTLQLPGL